MGQQILGSDMIVRMNDFDLLGMVQSVDWAPNFNAQDIFELGRDSKIATSMEMETGGSLELLSIGGTAGILARMLVKRHPTTDVFQGYQFDSAGAGGKNGYTFTQSDLRESQMDLIIHEKPDQQDFTRSVILPRCYLTSLSGRADANGLASETLNFAGQEVIGAVQPYHDVRVVAATVNTATGRLDFVDTTILAASWTVMYAYIDDIRLRTTVGDGQYVAFDGANARLNVTGLSLVPYAKSIASVIVYKTTPSTVFPVITAGMRTTSAFFIRGWQINIYIAPATPTAPVDAERWLRVQSVDWSIDMRTEALRQIAFSAQGSSVYCRLPTYPLSISANISVYETDWADWKSMLSKTFPGTDVYQDTYDFAPVNMKDSFSVVVEYRTKNNVLLQRWNFSDMRVDGSGRRGNIGGRSEVSWSLNGTAFSLQGFNA